jgi:hypothetical protein
MQTEKKLIQAWVPADLHRAVEEAARRDQRTVPSWVRKRFSELVLEENATRRETRRQEAQAS